MKKELMRQLGILTKLTAVLVLAACGGSDPASTETPRQTKLIFSDPNWSTALLQNAVARAILEKGYGYETESVAGTTISLMEALIAGETNVTMEIWLPSQQAIWYEAVDAGTVVSLGNSLANRAWESAFLIPQYTADANPGLRSVEELKLEEYRNLFVRPDSDGKAGLVTCLAGWECKEVIEKQVYGYGLQEVIKLITPSSFEALNAEILSAFEKRENILFHYWGPEVIPAKLDVQYGGFYRLEEPDYSDECWGQMTATSAAQDVTQMQYGGFYRLEEPDYSDECWGQMTATSAAQDVTHLNPTGFVFHAAFIGVRSELRETAPEAVAFFEKWTLSDDQVNALLVRFDETGDAYSDVAAWWLRNSDEWKNWVASGVADKVLAGL